MKSNDLRTKSEADNSSGVLVNNKFSNKTKGYLILVFVALLAVLSIGMAKDMLRHHYGAPIVILALILFYVISLIFIKNLRKIKYDPVNTYQLNSPNSFKFLIIIFLIITIIPAITNFFALFIIRHFGILSIIKAGFFIMMFYLFLDLFIKVTKYSKKSATSIKVKSLGISHFRLFVNLPENFNLQHFSQLKELPFDRTLISGFRPFLVNRFEDEKGMLILNYSDTDQLKFSLLFKQNSNKASIYYNKKNNAVKDIEDELIRVIYEFNDLPKPS